MSELAKYLKSEEEVKKIIHQMAEDLTVQDLVDLMGLPPMTDEQKKELARLEKEQRKAEDKEANAHKDKAL
ncbi:hypothetical protein [Lentilactobacillus kisonensis]|uniref:Uncharacterized protein n=2 Tax=Lentilactobacillus kisonensis TaxID=481722 RepID=H1LJ10_9LACO|nr:hypothetical protein [Lentilactobacillus kisonensis]EHO49437.1 hypothetical protein HMPREF9104_02602 [Lentilactobacillus kisonensis F0435]KRL22374.1 hypothetical protein FC98_GL002508 [Lentilactobacillus kisonensis DSM 19906 = JCM 15041]